MSAATGRAVGVPLGRRRRWSTWARTHTCHPRAWVGATSVPEIRAAVALARRLDVPLRPAGAGRSGSGLAMTDGVVVDLAGLDRVLDVDSAAGEVVVEPGITLQRLSRHLAAHGLALETTGECDQVTVGGAIATAMHASGTAFGSLSSRVRELDLVLPDGSLVTASPAGHPRLYAAARVGLGAFGIVTRVRLAVVPAFALHVQQRSVSVEEVLQTVEWLVAEHDHVDLRWYPQTGSCLVRTMDRLPADAAGRAGAAGVLQRAEGGGRAAVGAVLPRVVRGSDALADRLTTRTDQVLPAPAAFVRPHPVRFRESEYALPRALLADVVTDLQRWFERAGRRAGLGVRIRFGAPEDAWLAPTHSRHTAYVAARLPHTSPDGGWFAGLQEIALARGGRPSWAGAHGLDAATLSRLYPRFGDALAVRDEVDPQRLLRNGYLDRVLGR